MHGGNRRRGKSAFVLAAVLAMAACEDRPEMAIEIPVADAAPPLSQGNAPDAGSDDDGSTALAGNSIDARPGESEAGSSAAIVPGANPVATLVVLPDTQYYAESFPDIYTAQTRWIAAQAKARNIQAVLHLGDVVNVYDSTDEWANASAAMRLLDGVVPYILVPGNHDVGDDLNLRDSMIDNYFAPQTLPWVAGTFETGRIENNYALLDIGSHKYVVIGLEWGPRSTVLAWADSILKAYAAYPAILITHAFLENDARYDWSLYPNNVGQYWNPHWYAEDYAHRHPNTPVADVNDGEEIYQKLVLPNPNVRMVFSGHVLGDLTYGAVGRLTDNRPDGSHIHQMLANYQVLPLSGLPCGLGYLRIVELDTAKREIRVSTYSPYLDQIMSLPASEAIFTLPLDDSP